jgi:hypothetical protein
MMTFIAKSLETSVPVTDTQPDAIPTSPFFVKHIKPSTTVQGAEIPNPSIISQNPSAVGAVPVKVKHVEAVTEVPPLDTVVVPAVRLVKTVFIVLRAELRVVALFAVVEATEA